MTLRVTAPNPKSRAGRSTPRLQVVPLPEAAPATLSFSIAIPCPPSTNQLFATVNKRRVKSQHYKAWIEHAGYMVNKEKPTPIKGKVKIWLALPRSARLDPDNAFKASLDLLVRHSLIDDDNYKTIEGLAMFWHDRPGDEATILVVSA